MINLNRKEEKIPEEFKKLAPEQQGKEVQKDWNRYMREK